MNIIAERNLFVNTSSVIDGSGRDVTINLPQDYADCKMNQQMKMTLSSFLMEKKFYNINSTNNKLFLTAYQEGTGVPWKILGNMCTITEGNYRSFGGRQVQGIDVTATPTPKFTFWYDPNGLGYAIKTAIEHGLGMDWTKNANGSFQYEAYTPNNGAPFVQYTGATKYDVEDLVVVEFDSLKMVYTISIQIPAVMQRNVTTFPVPAPPIAVPDPGVLNFGLFSFELPNYRAVQGSIINQIIGTNFQATFVDTHELLGGCAVDQNDLTTNNKAAYDQLTKLYREGVQVIANSIQYSIASGYYQASLRTIEAVYVRSDLSSSNFQTASFDSGNNLYPYVISSTILAKIPTDNPQQIYTNEFYPTPTNKPAAGDETYFEPILYSYNDFAVPWEYLSFLDQGGNIWGAMLNTNHVSQLRLFITDDKGRPIPWQSDEQRKCNEMYFTATLKITIYEKSE